MIILKIKVNIYINKVNDGGHLFYTSNKEKYPWLGVWMFKHEGGRELLSDSVFLYYPESSKFEPGNLYTTNITLFVTDINLGYFKSGNKFKIQAGQLYDNQYWATGEILEVLDENEIETSQKD